MYNHAWLIQVLLSAIIQCDGVRAVAGPHVSFDTSGLLAEAVQLLYGLYRLVAKMNYI